MIGALSLGERYGVFDIVLSFKYYLDIKRYTYNQNKR